MVLYVFTEAVMPRSFVLVEHLHPFLVSFLNKMIQMAFHPFHQLPCCKGATFFKTPGSPTDRGLLPVPAAKWGNTRRQRACTLHNGRHARPLGARWYWEISCDRRMPPAGISGRKDEVKAWRWDPRNSVKCVERLPRSYFYVPRLPTFSAALIVRKLGEATWDELHRERSHRLHFIFSSHRDAMLWTEPFFSHHN